MHYKRRLKELESIVNIPIEVDFFVPYIDIRIKDIKYCGKIKVNFFKDLKVWILQNIMLQFILFLKA